MADSVKREGEIRDRMRRREKGKGMTEEEMKREERRKTKE
jgi:hypothetical protein